jgi:hypothetical protein
MTRWTTEHVIGACAKLADALLPKPESAAARSRWIVCSHEPQCPSAGHTARMAAHVIAGHPEQGWSLLCNGIVLFDDGGLLLPDGRAAAPAARPLPVIAA